MPISNISSSPPYNYSSLSSKSKNNGDTTATRQQDTSSTDSTVQDFLSYLKESPAQRWFDKFLAAHHLSKDDFNAMSSAEKQKLIDEFKREMEDQMKKKMGVNTSTSGVNIVA